MGNKNQKPDNYKLYEENWQDWNNMKIHGPASNFLRYLITESLDSIDSKYSVRSVLDVGCGEGTNTALIAKLFSDASVIGIDFSLTGIECAQQRYKFQNLLFKHDINSEALNLKYDLVTCFEVIEHVEDWKGFLKMIASASDKYVLISTPTGKMREFEVNVGHLRNFKKNEVENEMQNLGFKTVRAYYAGFPFYSPIYRDLCNKMNVGGNSFEKGEYSFKQRLISNIIYFSFRYLSTKKNHGDKFCALFEKNS
jgi:trans-aconitate methyltransferase